VLGVRRAVPLVMPDLSVTGFQVPGWFGRPFGRAIRHQRHPLPLQDETTSEEGGGVRESIHPKMGLWVPGEPGKKMRRLETAKSRT
jgi:hypothetical protein